MINKDDIEAFTPEHSETPKPETASLRGAAGKVAPCRGHDTASEGFGLAQLTPPNPADTLAEIGAKRPNDPPPRGLKNKDNGKKYVDHKHVLDIIAEFRVKRATLNGCSSRFCNITGRRHGMVTNGSCNCLRHPDAQQRRDLEKVAHWTQDMIASLEKLY